MLQCAVADTTDGQALIAHTLDGSTLHCLWRKCVYNCIPPSRIFLPLASHQLNIYASRYAEKGKNSTSYAQQVEARTEILGADHVA